eukprot:110891_1
MVNIGQLAILVYFPTTESKHKEIVTTRNTKSCEFDKHITACDSFQRILNILNNYDKWIDCKQQQHKPFCNIVSDQDAKYDNSILLDDYHHIIYYHNFRDIYYNTIKTNTIECISSINNGICLNRNYRDRINDNNKLYFGLTECEINTEQIM